MGRSNRSIATSLAVALVATASQAAPVQREVLKELQLTQVGQCQRIVTTLEFPIAVEGFSPLQHGQFLVVRVQPLHAPGEPAPSMLETREALIPENRDNTALTQVTWESDNSSAPQLIFQFARDTHYDITTGGDNRSVVVTIHPENGSLASCHD